MQTIAPLSAATPKPAPAPKAVALPKSAGVINSVRESVADIVRGAGAGYLAAANQTGVQADKTTIYPFESVVTATGLLKQKTANIKGLNKVTNLVNLGGTFALLIGAMTVSSTVKAPGQTGKDVAFKIADLIDGRKSHNGWSLGMGIVTPNGDGTNAASQSDIGAAFANAGL